jgi:methionyl-tRNA formyltransferase
MIRKFLIVGNRPWCNKVFNSLKIKDCKFYFYKNENQFNLKNIKKIRPEKIFILHWNFFVPKKIYQNYECIVFHMTDLPFGKGGSPLQNLIMRGYKHSKLSSIKCAEKIDSGPIYLKKKYSLSGTATEIFARIGKISILMIKSIIKNTIVPKKQKGKSITFKRRTLSQNDLSNAKNITEVYNMIRMLDGELYPKAYLNFGKFKIMFNKANLKNNKLISQVEFIKYD